MRKRGTLLQRKHKESKFEKGAKTENEDYRVKFGIGGFILKPQTEESHVSL